MQTGVFGSDHQTEKLENIKAIFDKLKSLGTGVKIERGFYRYLSEELGYQPDTDGIIDSDPCPLDLILSIGGDGTFLKTAAWVGRQEVPIVGVNTGRLGFLADIGTSEIDIALERIFQCDYRLEDRSLLEINSSHLNRNDNFALNEIAVQKRDTSAMIAVHTWLNGEYLTAYLADGLLIATPTGSTAYSMSVNGPLIVPEARNFTLSPIAPHSLNVRPLVVPDDYTIRLKVESRDRNFLVSLDGRSEIFPSGSEFLIRKAPFSIKIVKLAGHGFYGKLRDKLLWGTDKRRSEK